MAKFQYYITNLYDGNVYGTDDEADARLYAENEDFFVVNATAGEWLQAGGGAVDIIQARIPTDN